MNRLATGLAALSLLCAGAAAAAPINPLFDTFGDIQNEASIPVTFGGSGIPTSPAAISRFTADNGDELVLGLMAHQRFANPPLTNDGAGTYFATPGANNGFGSSALIGATWNFALYAEAIDNTPDNGEMASLVGFELFLQYDFDPAAGTDEADLGLWDLGSTIIAFNLAQDIFQTSQNLNFGFLSAASAIIAPPSGAFNPLAAGEYSFRLGSTLGSVAINVNVNAIPLPAPALLLLTGLAGLGAMRLRRRVA